MVEECSKKLQCYAMQYKEGDKGMTHQDLVRETDNKAEAKFEEGSRLKDIQVQGGEQGEES